MNTVNLTPFYLDTTADLHPEIMSLKKGEKHSGPICGIQQQ